MTRADRLSKVIKMLKPIEPVKMISLFKTDDGSIFKIEQDQSHTPITTDEYLTMRDSNKFIIMVHYESKSGCELLIPNLKK